MYVLKAEFYTSEMLGDAECRPVTHVSVFVLKLYSFEEMLKVSLAACKGPISTKGWYEA